MPKREPSHLRRVIAGACHCGGAFVLDQDQIETLEAARAAVEGQGTLLAWLRPGQLPLRRDVYRCEQGCVGGASRLVDAQGETVWLYGRPAVRVW